MKIKPLRKIKTKTDKTYDKELHKSDANGVENIAPLNNEHSHQNGLEKNANITSNGDYQNGDTDVNDYHNSDSDGDMFDEDNLNLHGYSKISKGCGQDIQLEDPNKKELLVRFLKIGIMVICDGDRDLIKF